MTPLLDAIRAALDAVEHAGVEWDKPMTDVTAATFAVIWEQVKILLPAARQALAEMERQGEGAGEITDERIQNLLNAADQAERGGAPRSA